MRKITIVFLIIFNSFYSFGQNISKLDNANGFKEFKFGDDYKLWQKYFKYEPSNYWDKYGINHIYNGDCCQTAFGFNVDEISLHFNNKKKLDGISLKVISYSREKIASIIKKAFGPCKILEDEL